MEQKNSSYYGYFEIYIISPSCVWFSLCLGLFLPLTPLLMYPIVSIVAYTCYISYDISSVIVIDFGYVVFIDIFGAASYDGGARATTCNGGIGSTMCGCSIA